MDDSLGLVDRGGVIAEETEGEDVDDPSPLKFEISNSSAGLDLDQERSVPR